jgi:hypothetical protein
VTTLGLWSQSPTDDESFRRQPLLVPPTSESPRVRLLRGAPEVVGSGSRRCATVRERQSVASAAR